MLKVALGAHVTVWWHDSATSVGWEGRGAGKDNSPEDVESVGVVIGTTPRFLILCGDRNADHSDDSNNRRIKIPRTAIDRVDVHGPGTTAWERKRRAVRVAQV